MAPSLHRPAQWRGPGMRTDELAAHYQAALTIAGILLGPSHDPRDAARPDAVDRRARPGNTNGGPGASRARRRASFVSVAG